jgi:DNA-binding winged helix-turn-helix (wHTH) protein
MAFTPQELQAGFRIGECLIEPLQNRIIRGAAEVRVEPRVMDVLMCLAEHAGEVVSRETLNRQVWGNVVVTDQAVTNCISELRQHLRDDRASHRVIETIPKRGYQLTAVVQLLGSYNVVTPPAARRWSLIVGVFLIVAVGLATVGATLWWRNASTPTLTSIAVLPFENASRDNTLDYLGLALPDEVATLLTKSRDLAVRPLGYVDGKDPLAVARARRVDHIVSGRFYLQENGELGLAIEALNVKQDA